MDALFTEAFMPLWALALALALFFPVRQFIWVLYVRRAMRRIEVDEAERARLKRRAGVTSGLLCFVFAYIYTSYLFQGVP
jgi:hypothetical protein